MIPSLNELIISNKALSIFFIMLICLINFPLIYQVRNPLFYQNVKWMTIISLAIGDVILACFPLVVMAKQYFDPSWVIPCKLGMAYVIYIRYLIHFVYGMGVIVLGAEVLLRHKLQANGKRTVSALFLSSLPWTVGLIIILPLTLVNVDYSKCVINRPTQDLFGVSVLFPASLAFVATLLLNCLNLSLIDKTVAYSQLSIAYSQQSVAYSQQRLALPVPSQEPHNQQILGNFNSYQNPNQQYPEYSPPPYDVAYNYQYPNSQQGQTHQHGSNQSNAGHHATAVQQATNQAGFGTNLNSNRQKEAHWLATIYCAMVLPFAFHSVTTGYASRKEGFPINIFRECLYWLSIGRSFVTPVVMFKYSKM